MSAGRVRFALARSDAGAWGSDNPEPGLLTTATVWRSTDIDASGAWIDGSEPAERYLTPHDARGSALSCGDVLVTKASGSPRHIGKAALVDSCREGHGFSNFMQRLTVVPGQSPAYLWHLLNSLVARAHYAQFATTTTGLKNLNGGLIGGVPLPVASGLHQTAIANFLDRECALIDRLVDEFARTRELTQDWLRSRIVEVLDTFNGDVPFGRYATLHRGFDLPAEDRFAGDVVVVGSGGQTGLHNVPAAPGPAVVTGRYGSIGVVTWSEAPCWPLNTTLWVSDFKQSDPRFVYWALQGLPLRQEASKAAIPGLHRADIHRLPLGSFTVTEQRAIVKSLDALARETQGVRDELEHQQSLLAEYRDALITEAVTGQLDVSSLSESQMIESLDAVREGEPPEVLAR